MSLPGSTTDVLVIGAGPAGLTAAYLLTRADAGHRRARGRPELRRRHQPHRRVQGLPLRHRRPPLLLEVEEVEDLWNEILPDDFIERPRLVAHLLRRQVLPLSAQGRRGPAQARRLRAARCACCPTRWAGCGRSRTRSSFEDWVRNQFGRRLFEIFFKTYTEKVWGMSCDEISADWAAQRIKGLDLGARRSGTRCCAQARQAARTERRGHQDPDRHLPLSRAGPRQMWEACAAQDPRAGRRASQMGRERDAAAATTREPARGRSLPRRARRRDRDATTAAPLHLVGADPRADRRIEPAPLAEPSPRAEALRYRDFLTVVLIVEGPRPLPRQLDLHPRPDGQGRPHPELQELVARDGARPGARPARPRILLLRGRRPLARPTTTSSSSPARDRRRSASCEPSDVVDGCVVRQPKAYPVYDDDYTRHVDDDPRRARGALPDACTWSAATACTSTTTRTTR